MVNLSNEMQVYIAERNMAGDELARRGWHLTNKGIEDLAESGAKGVDQLIRTAIDTDLRDIGDKWLPEELHKGKLDYVQGPAVLQLMKLRNISAPKDNEESQAAPRLLRLSLTDGHMSCTAIEIENLKNINLGTPPGTKVLLDGAVDVENNLLLLTNKNFRCLGGRVEKLVETWELKRKLAKQSRSGVQTEGGPPLFVPFGKKAPAATRDFIPKEKKENFKSLESSKKDKKEETEFEQQRQATIAEALQDGKTKTFGGGGGKQPVQDRDVARIVEMGFTVDQATNALRQNSSVSEAISALISRGDSFRSAPRGGGRGGGRGGDRFGNREQREQRDPRQGGRGRRGRDRDDDVEDAGHSRPSGPATLFDFLETKIPVKEESKSGTASNRSNSSQSNRSQANSSSNHNQYSSSYKPHENGNTRPSYKSSQNHQQSHQADSSGQNFQNRKQNLPPRFAGKQDGQSSNFHQQRTTSQRDYSNSYDSDRTQRGGNSQRRTENQSQSTRPDSNYQSRPKSSSYNSSGASERQDYHKENRYDDRQEFRQDSRYEGQQDSRHDGRYGNQRGNRQQQDHRSYDQRNQGSRQQDGPKKSYEQPQSGPPQERGHSWRRGDQCLAKYWEDGQFYSVRIEDFAPNGATCVVTFLEYGNMEEVLLSDVKPFPQQAWQAQNNSRQFNKGQGQSQQPYYNNQPPNAGTLMMQNPPSFPRQDTYAGAGTINSMEFRRGGGKTRPTQQFYNPPTRQYPS